MSFVSIPRRNSLSGWLLALLLFGGGMALMFRFLPAHSIGDNGDSLIVMATLEHWFRVLIGQAADWRSPGWFWPAQGTIGLTDSYALMAVPYSLARELGVGPFGALTASVASLSVAGFWGMLLLLRAIGVPAAIGGVMGFVFAFGAVVTFKLGHAQTYTVMLAPWVGLALLLGARLRGAGGMALAASGGLLFGLMTLTAPQTGWFLGFEAGIAGVLAAAFGGVPMARGRARRARPAWPVLLACLLGLALGLAPIPVLYAAGMGRERGWSEVAFYLPRLGDIVNIPAGNLLWFDLLQGLGLAGGRPDLASEVALGFTPVLAASALLALLGLPLVRQAAGPHPWDRAAAAFLLAAALAWLLSVGYGPITPWRLIWENVPGASAIRTPFRLQLASYFFVLLALGHVFARALRAASERGSGWAAVLGAALALLVVEQLGPTPTARETWPTARWLLAAHRPDFPCRAFYVVSPPPGPERWYEYQAEAMLLSAWLGMPTINGDSSWTPAGWDLLFPDRPDYAAKALDWIERNQVGDQVCGLEVRTGRWTQGLGPLLEAERPQP